MSKFGIISVIFSVLITVSYPNEAVAQLVRGNAATLYMQRELPFSIKTKTSEWNKFRCTGNYEATKRRSPYWLCSMLNKKNNTALGLFRMETGEKDRVIEELFQRFYRGDTHNLNQLGDDVNMKVGGVSIAVKHYQVSWDRSSYEPFVSTAIFTIPGSEFTYVLRAGNLGRKSGGAYETKELFESFLRDGHLEFIPVSSESSFKVSEETLKDFAGTGWDASWTTPIGRTFSESFQFKSKGGTLWVSFQDGFESKVNEEAGGLMFINRIGFTFKVMSKGEELTGGNVMGVIPFNGRAFTLPLAFAKK